MKNRLYKILTICMILLWTGMPVHAQNHAQLDYVTDDAGLLTAEEWEELEREAERISEAYECGTYIYTLDDMWEYDYDDAMEFAKDVYREYDLGWGDGRDGILLVLSMAARDYSVVAYGDFANMSFTDYGRGEMEGHFLEEFADDQWADGFESYLDDCEDYLELAHAGTPYDADTEGGGFLTTLLMVVGIPCVISGIICLIFLSQMKAAVKQGSADAYVTENGIQVRTREDRFTHETVTRRKIESSSDKGGTSVGSDGFSGSKGKF